MQTRSPGPQRPGSNWLCLVLACGLTLSAPNLLAQTAKPTPPANPSAHATEVPKTLRSYTPKAGESLDSVIANTMGDSPLRIELLRQAYVELNPTAFLPGKTPRLRKGVVLSVPDHEQLLRKIQQARSATTEQHQNQSVSAEERRRWVRFP